MKFILPSLLVLLVLTVTPARARLGESGDQIVARYGQPLSEIDQKAEGKKVALTVLVFQKNGYQIQVSISDGVSDEESFRKLNGEAMTVGRDAHTAQRECAGFRLGGTDGHERRKNLDARRRLDCHRQC